MTLVAIAVYITIKQEYAALYATGTSPHPWGLMRVFYLCDGVIFMAGYITGTSYELINILIFGVLQPALILGLTILLFTYRFKLRKHEHLQTS